MSMGNWCGGDKFISAKKTLRVAIRMWRLPIVNYVVIESMIRISISSYANEVQKSYHKSNTSQNTC